MVIFIRYASLFLCLANIIHLPSKQANVFIDEQGHAQLADFGLVVVGETLVGNSSSGGAGNVRYMAPERMNPTSLNKQRTAPADVFSFGSLCFFVGPVVSLSSRGITDSSAAVYGPPTISSNVKVCGGNSRHRRWSRGKTKQWRLPPRDWRFDVDDDHALLGRKSGLASFHGRG
jgi:serine/threonine protein kinase